MWSVLLLILHGSLWLLLLLQLNVIRSVWLSVHTHDICDIGDDSSRTLFFPLLVFFLLNSHVQSYVCFVSSLFFLSGLISVPVSKVKWIGVFDLFAVEFSKTNTFYLKYSWFYFSLFNHNFNFFFSSSLHFHLVCVCECMLYIATPKFRWNFTLHSRRQRNL